MRVSGLRPLLVLVAALIACGALYRALPTGEYATYDWWEIGTTPDVLREAAHRWENGGAFDVLLLGGVLVGGLVTLVACAVWLYGQQAAEANHGGRLLVAIVLCMGGWYWATRMNLLPLQLFFGIPAGVLALATLRPITIIFIRPRHTHQQTTGEGRGIRPKYKPEKDPGPMPNLIRRERRKKKATKKKKPGWLHWLEPQPLYRVGEIVQLTTSERWGHYARIEAVGAEQPFFYDVTDKTTGERLVVPERVIIPLKHALE